jgi:hypothetical protein
MFNEKLDGADLTGVLSQTRYSRTDTIPLSLAEWGLEIFFLSG